MSAKTRKNAPEESATDVMFTVHLEFALPHSDVFQVSQNAITTGQQTQNEALMGRRGTWVENGHLSVYIHFEFELPLYPNPIKVDVVSRPSMAKVFLDNQEIQNASYTFDADGQAWLLLDLTYPVQQGERSASELFSKGFNLKIWDTRDKVSSRARFDRPPVAQVATKKRDKLGLERERATSVMWDSKRGSAQQSSSPEKNTAALSAARSRASNVSVVSEPRASVVDPYKQAEAAMKLVMPENPGATLSLAMHPFFINLSTASMLYKGDVLSGLVFLKQIKLSVSSKTPFLSPELRFKLNPAVFTLNSIESLPSQPLSYAELSRTCQPIWGIMRMDPFPIMRFTSPSTKRGPNEELNVYFIALAGLVPVDELIKIFTTNPLVVEVHDRSRSKPEQLEVAHIFGEDPLDVQKIITPGVSTKNNPFKSKWEPWDPYGVCQFNLSDLGSGAKWVRFNSILLPTKEEPPEENIVQLLSTTNTSRRPAGRYVEAGTSVTITVTLSHSVHEYQTPAAKALIAAAANVPAKPTPFSRVVVVNKGRGFAKFVERVIAYVTQCNCEALGLVGLDSDARALALATYDLSKAQMSDLSLDILTGFVFCDKHTGLVVLEGLASQAISRVLTDLLLEERAKNKHVSLLFNSAHLFETRLYLPFGPRLYPLYFAFSLRRLLTDKSLYIQDQSTWAPLPTLLMLQELITCPSLKELVDARQFPSSADLERLDVQYSTSPFVEHGHTGTRPLSGLSNPSRVPSAYSRVTSAHSSSTLGKQRETVVLFEPAERVDHWNKDYVASKLSALDPVDHIRLNKQAVQVQSDANAKAHPKPEMFSLPVLGPVHPYSSQTFNSTELTRTALQQTLRTQPRDASTTGTFTFSDQFHSLAFPLVDEQTKRKEELAASQTLWKTHGGFDLSPKVEPAKHEPSLFPPAEAATNPQILLDGRAPLPWDRRKDDFRATRVAEEHHLPSIQLAGDTLKAEARAARDKELAEWRSKLVGEETFRSPLKLAEPRQSLLHDSAKKLGISGKFSLDDPLHSTI